MSKDQEERPWIVIVKYQDGLVDTFTIEALWQLYDLIHVGTDKTDEDVLSILITPTKAGI